MKSLRTLARYAGIFALTLALLWGGLVLCAAIPNERIRDPMLRTAQGYAGAERYEFAASGRLRTAADNHADTIWLNVAWNMGTGDPVAGSLDTGYHDGGFGPTAGLYRTVARGAAPDVDYSRYWHGTAGVLRLLHLWLEGSGIKGLGLAAAGLLLALTAGLLLRRGHGDLALALLLALALVQAWDLRLSFEYQPAFLLCFLFCPVWLVLERRGDGLLPALSLVAGVMTAFFDFLTTETLPLLLPLLLITAVRGKEGRLPEGKRTLGLFLRCGICWLLAYGATFAVKWAAVSLLTGENRIAAAAASMLYRMGSRVADSGGREEIGPFDGLLANLSMLFGSRDRIDGPALARLVPASLGILGWLLHRFRRPGPVHRATAAVLLPGLAVPLRFLVLGNHSYMHCFFTYRALAATLFALLAAMALNMDLKRKGGGCHDGSNGADALPE